MDFAGLCLVVHVACATILPSIAPAAAGAMDGMSMARMLACDMGGVLVERTPERHDWSATAFLPLPDLARPTLPPAMADPRVLAVEDSPSNRHRLLTVLSSLGPLPHHRERRHRSGRCD